MGAIRLRSGEFGPWWNQNIIFNFVLLIGIFKSSNDNALIWMSWDLTDDKLRLVQVMAWCRQATSHYLSQSWPSFMSPYGVTRPQWVRLTLCRLYSYCPWLLPRWGAAGSQSRHQMPTLPESDVANSPKPTHPVSDRISPGTGNEASLPSPSGEAVCFHKQLP